MGVTIRELSERTRVKIPTIRYYERQGLLPAPARSNMGYRAYGAVDVARVRFVRFGRGLGLDINEIRALIEMIGEGNSEEIVVLSDSVADRAERMRLFSERLRSVSVAMSTGSIDEVDAFDRIVEAEEQSVGVGFEEPPSPEALKIERESTPHEPRQEASESERLAMMAQPIPEAPRELTAVMENKGLETPTPPPNRKRNRAKS